MRSYKLVLLVLWDVEQLKVLAPTLFRFKNGMHEQEKEVIPNNHIHLQFAMLFPC
jgi:hypothetical protein